MVEGLMTFGKLESGQRTLDFECCEDVAAEAFKGNFQVQGMRDGNVYMSELPKRHKNKPLFREDNSSLTMGRDGRVYYHFWLPKERLAELPEKLVHQSLAMAQKVERMMAEKKGGMR